jgi:gliding motility-associated-like protein
MKYILGTLFCVLVLFTNKIYGQGDNCYDAYHITDPSNFCSTANFSNQGATAMVTNSGTLASAACWTASSDKDVWFVFNATGTTADITIDGTEASSFPWIYGPAVALYEGTCTGNSSSYTSNFTSIAGCKQASSFSSTTNTVINNLTKGNQYFIRVSSTNGNRGNFTLCLNNYDPAPVGSADCSGAIKVCSKSTTLSAGSITSPGTNSTETNNAKLNGNGMNEHATIWYYFTCGKPGTLTFNIKPKDISNDIDFGVYQVPSSNPCGALTPLRINTTSCIVGDGSTGLNATSTDIQEVSGCSSGTQDAFCKFIDMTENTTYVLVIDNADGKNGFDLTWGGTGTFSPDPLMTLSPAKTNFCTGDIINYSGTSTKGYSTLNWTFTNTGTAQKVTGTTSTQTYSTAGVFTEKLVATNNIGCKDSITQTIYVNNLPTVNLTPATTTLCPSATVDLTGNITTTGKYNNAGVETLNTIKTITWIPLAGSNINLTNTVLPSSPYGQTGTTTTTASAQNGNVKLSVTDQSGCTTVATSTITIATPGAPTASGITICTGNTTTLNATGSTGASFKWYNAATAGTVLSTTSSYTTPTLSTTTSYWVTQTVGGCESARTKVDVTINPCVCTPPTITQPTAKTICAGANTTFSITASGTTNNAFQWQVNTGSGWTNITNGGVYSGATTNTLTITAGTAGMNGYQYKCIAYEATSTCPATSNAVVLTVDPTNVGGSITTATTVCTGSASGLLTLAGNTGAVTKWQSSTSPFSTWTDIANTTATYTSGALTQTTQFRAVVQSGSCPAVNSSPVTITVDQNNIGGTVTTSKTICPNATSGVLTLGGNTGAVTKWQSATSPFSSWTDIANTATTYTSGALSQTTQFRAVVQSGTCPAVNSTPATITIGTVQTLNIQCGTSTTNTVEFTWTNITDATSYSYSYTINGAGVPTTGTLAAGTTTHTINGLSAGQTVNFTLTPVGSQCAVQESHDCVAINCPTPTVTQVSDVTLCSGATLSAINFVSPEGATTFNWSNTNSTFGLAATGSGSIGSITVGNVLTSQTATISVNATSGGCTGPTMTFNINVTPLNTITLNSAIGSDAQTVCVNSAISNIGYLTTGAIGATFSGLPSGVTGNWNAGVVTLTGSPTTSVGSPFTYTITLTGGCGNITTTGTITVTPINTITLSSAAGSDAQTVCINTNINNITYTTTGASGATFNGLPNGVIGNWNANTVTISGAPTTISGSPFSYTINLTGGCGLVNTTGTVTVNPLNTVTLSSAVNSDNQNLCINTPLNTLTYTTTGATGANFSGLPNGVNGSWNNNSITISGSPTTSVGSPFTYTIDLVGGCGPVSTTGTISIITINTITLTSASGTDNQTICESSPINAISYNTTGATGATIGNLPPGVSGSWNNNSITFTGFPSTTVGSPFTYTIDLTGGCGTVGTTGTITVNPINTINLTSTVGTDGQTICVNSALTNITYASTGATGATITGLPAGVTGNWNANVFTIMGTPTSNIQSTYNYTITLTGGCGLVTALGTITVNPLNTITLSSSLGTDNQTLCINTSLSNISYTTTGATGANITNLPTGVTANWNANTVTISGTPSQSALTPFMYNIELTGGCGTINKTGNITINPDNVITLTSAAATENQAVCSGNAITNITYITSGATGATITGLPSGIVGNWSSNQITISGTSTNTANSPFSYLITLTGGCGNITDNGTILINSLPVFTPSSNTPCEATTLNLNANFSGATTYAWTGPNSFTSNIENPSINNAIPSQSGVYTLQLTDANGCIKQQSVTVTINPLDLIDMTPITHKCQKDNIFLLFATPTGGVWSGDGITNPATGEFDPQGTTTKLMPTKNVVNYTTVGTTCPNTRSFDIEINPNPVVDFAAEKVDLCEGDTLILHSLTTPSNVSLVWDFGNEVTSTETIAKYVYTTGGAFDIKQIAIINGCKSELTKTDYINVVAKPINVQFSQSTNTLDLYNPEVSFTTNTDALYYYWSFGDGKSTNVKNPTHLFPSQPDNYLVTLTASNILNHCSNSISHVIVMPEPVIYYIPNTFTPNGDEFNNTFQPIFTMGYDPQNYAFYIYNRWGELIFESHDSKIGWDGTFGDKLLKGDTFVWKLTFKEKNTSIEHNETGHVNILR